MSSKIKSESSMIDALSPESSSGSPAGSTLATSMSSTSSNQGEEIAKPTICRWGDCSKTYEDPEDLYVHLCNDHVGRKSTNNLCLTCKWEDCDVTCAKRDHITSHLRVHTPLKPHACDSCGKLFKRPQDLKKHERIHTEQHHQSRQAKYQMPNTSTNYPPYHLSQNQQPWSGVRGPESHVPSSSLYLSAHGSGPTTPSYHSGQSQLYPSLPSVGQQSQARYTNNYSQANVHRDHTPSYMQDSASTNSLSPLSSHIATPASGSSPAAAHAHQHSHSSRSQLDRGYISMQSERPRGNDDDPNSYSYLAQGSSSLAGSKRGHDAVATASFFDDVRRKRVVPTYDMAMAERIEHTFAHGIDDESLQDLLSNFATEAADRSSQGNSPARSQQSAFYPAQGHSHSKLSLPEAFKQTDLADLNAFLLQVGANASRVDSHAQESDSSAFDFANALNACGLTGVPGYDESLIQWPQEHISSHPSSSEAAQWASNNAMYSQRPIAQLPSRNNAYPHGHMVPQPHQYSQQGQQMMTHGQVSAFASFDSVRGARGPAYVPQLGPKEMSGSLYRHVEPLTRAEPISRPSIDSSLRSTTTATTGKDEAEDEEMVDVTPSSQGPSRSTSPISSSLKIYPRITSGDPSRRLPSPISYDRGSGSSSISSILDYPLSSRLQNRSDETTSNVSSSPSPSPSIYSTNDNEMTRSSSSSIYPSLSKDDGQDSMDGIEEDVAAMGVASKSIPSQVRKSHAKIIVELLMAINFPGKRDVRLAPIKLSPLHDRRDEEMESTRTSTYGRGVYRRSNNDDDEEGEGSDETETQRSTPKLESVRNLPKIASLLNEVDSRSEVKGAGGRRIMEANV